MRSLIVIPLALAAFNADAQDNWINIHLGSLHNKTEVVADNKQYNINQFNPGVGIEFPVKNYGKPSQHQSYRLGAFKNSYNDISTYAGINIHTMYTNGFGVGVTLGVVSGYKNSPIDSDVIPGVVPDLFYIFKDYRAELSFVYGQYASAIAFTVGMRY